MDVEVTSDANTVSNLLMRLLCDIIALDRKWQDQGFGL